MEGGSPLPPRILEKRSYWSALSLVSRQDHRAAVTHKTADDRKELHTK